MDKSTINLNGYEFKQFSSELEDLHQNHSEEVRRMPNITLYDQFALDELSDLYPQLYEQWIFQWSRSYYTSDKHLEAVMKYANQNIPINRLNQDVWTQAVDAVRDGLRNLQRVRALSVKTELDIVKYIQSSSAGYGYIGAKGPLREFNHMRAIKRALATLYSATAADGEGPDYAIRESVPDVGYTRTQLTDLTEKTKIRSVWGRSFHYILLEGTSAKPLLEGLMTNPTFIQIGSDPIFNVPAKLSELHEKFKWLYSVDWSTFDATVHRFEINTAFDLIKERLFFPDFDTEMAFELSRQLFIHKKIAAPDGKIYWSHKGIPSGSYFTSIIGSIVNRLRMEYLWRLKYGRGPGCCYTLGDDSLIGDDLYYNPQELSDTAMQYGWIINPDKTECSTNPGAITFLGRTSVGGQNQRDLKRCVRLLLLPEYPVASGDISAFRAKAIAQDAGGNSEVLNRIAKRLKQKYGIADESVVPSYFRVYQP
ncbi:MAG: RNA-dependent RNA polymerase [Plant associated deltapartitivirus 2]|nr:MAG: RNA-dependent RNA polymerase [Plant associated deltapartitivirus 2]